MGSFDWSGGLLAEGLKCYRREQFFEAHEHWEAVWMRCEGAEKKFVQALIQITVAFHHLQRENVVGAASLLRRALKKLEAYPEAYGGVDVGTLKESVRGWLRALGVDGSWRGMGFPRIGGE